MHRLPEVADGAASRGEDRSAVQRSLMAERGLGGEGRVDERNKGEGGCLGYP